MASLRKKADTPYFWACFTLPDGRRVQRSTKETKRKAAQTLADEWEKLSKEKAGARQMHKVISDIYRAAHGENIPGSSTRDFLEGWLARRQGEVKPASMIAYTGRVTDFLRFLGGADKQPIASLTTEIIQRYRDDLAARLSISTSNQAVKIIRFMLEDAYRDKLVAENVAKAVRPLKQMANKEPGRRPFTMPELRAVIQAADDEWRSLIYFGIYTGQRLADLAQLRWTNLDLAANELRLVTGKTGRTAIVPLCKPLLNHILSLPTNDNPSSPIHPRAISHVAVGGMAAGLSRQFGEILAAAGLRAATTHVAAKSGRSAKRTTSPITFHSLRHTATSLMKNAGISPAVVQDIIGHDSAEMSAHYTHIEHDAKKLALDALPDLTKL